MTHVILSGKRVDADLEAAPVGAFDVIRDDIKLISTVRPIDRVFVERTDTGYRGVLFSKEKPFIFALNGNGFSAKAVEDTVQVLGYCNELEEGERKITATLDARRSDSEIDEFNREMHNRPSSEDDETARLEDGALDTTRVWGPPPGDPIERVPGAYRKMMQGASISRMEGKSDRGVCAGGIVLNKEGKVLLVKPRSGFGGYDWTFPKGYPTKADGSVLAQTAVREVQEETGYRVFPNRLLGRFTHNDGGTCDYFYCDIDSSKPVGKYDEFETAAVRWASLTEALELLNDDVDVRILAQANNLLPKLLIKGGEHSGTMIALHIPKAIAKKVALPHGEKLSSLHITLVYLGKGLSEQQKKTAASVTRRFAGMIGSGIKVTLGGVGRFSASESSEGRDVVYLSVDSPQLTKLRPHLTDMLAEAGLAVPDNHGFVPHVTLAYIDKTERTPLERFEPIDIKFDDVSLSIGDKRMSFALKLSRANQQLKDVATRNAKALRLFVVRKKLHTMYGVDLNKANVKNPGSRGGKWYRDAKGEVQYGEKPGNPNAIDWKALGVAANNLPGELGDLDPRYESDLEPRYEEQKIVRRTLRAILAKEGVTKAPMGVYGAEDRIAANDRTLEVGAAYHNWMGDTWLSKNVQRRFVALCKAMSSGGTVERQHMEAMSTMLHEELHGLSDMVSDAYVGVGIVIEEVTTEMAARVVLRRQFGDVMQLYWDDEPPQEVRTDVQYTAAGGGSYSDEIASVVKCVVSVLETRVDNDDSTQPYPLANSMLEDACLEMKRRKLKLANTATEHLNNFVTCFDNLSLGEREILAGLIEDMGES